MKNKLETNFVASETQLRESNWKLFKSFVLFQEEMSVMERK